MNAVSPWAAGADYALENARILPIIYQKSASIYTFKIHVTDDSAWIVVEWPQKGRISFRPVYSPGGGLLLKQKKPTEQGIEFSLHGTAGDFRVRILITETDHPVLHYTTTLKPGQDLMFPFWPRDIFVPPVQKDGKKTASGKVHVNQMGTRSGLLYMTLSKPGSSSLLYMQNLTSLAGYCQQTETSSANVVGGQWPETGFTLPVTKDKPLQSGKEVIISDAIIAFDPEIPSSEAKKTEQFLNLLSTVYLNLPKPPTTYQDWPAILQKGLTDLIERPECWSQVSGHRYFNAYVCDHETPPEIMVQLAVLLPLIDYCEWNQSDLLVIQTIKAGLPAFYNKEIGSIVRWLPAAEHRLKGEEEQKRPMVMDSWYLHHPLLNLSRLALKGDQAAEKLFLNSLEFAIQVAHQFKYQWPVFYKMDTLEIVKAETSPGKGGEKDVPGTYAHIMLQAWELTGKKRYLEEAEKAVLMLKGLGFDLFYQANNTAFSAGVLIRLWKITKKKTYLDLSHLCIANLLKNVHLWECKYGYGKNYPSFFALYPLNDAPYTAAYEEQEVFCAMHEYLKHAEGTKLLPAVNLLLAEYIRYLVNRAAFYYPTMLPKDMLEEKPKTGELDPKLWIALEDLHDGWEKSGSVGQEVYGAGNAFGILPRHYMKVPDQPFMIYVDYPTTHFFCEKDKPINFQIKGDERLTCRMMIVKTTQGKLPDFVVRANNTIIKGTITEASHIEYEVKGSWAISIKYT